MAHLDRLPALTPAMVLEATRFEVFRDQFGMQQCLLRGIGPVRKKLGPAPADVETGALSPEELARDGARVVLAGMCRICPLTGCRMKTWGMG